jgi:hypothetical protein
MLFLALLVWGLLVSAQGQVLNEEGLSSWGQENLVPISQPSDRGGSVLFSTLGGIDPVTSSVITSQVFTDFGGFATAGADDFTVTGNGWEIESVEARGAYFNGAGPADSVNVYILGVSGGLPDTTNLSAGSIYALENASYTDIGSGDFEIPLVPDGQPGIFLPPGDYFLVVQANMAAGSGGQWGWTLSASGPNSGTSVGLESAWFQTSPGLIPPGSCVDTWGARVSTCNMTPMPDPSPPAELDFAFALTGNQPVPGITVTPTTVTTSEAGVTDSFDVVLDAPPLPGEMVSIDIDDSAGATEGSAGVGTLVFTAANWNIPQTVTITPLDDAIADGNVMWTCATDPAVSGDGSYSGLDAADVTVTNLDDETAGITVSPVSGLMVAENGGTAMFDVNANSAPTDDVTVPLSINIGQATVAASVMLPSGSTAAQTVMVTGIDDDIDTGDLPFTVTTGDPTSAGDAVYDALGAGDVPDVTGTFLNDDTAGITVTSIPNPLSTDETDGGRGSNTVSFVLDSEPSFDVVLNLQSSDTTEANISSNMLTFTPGNWDTAQMITVLGVDDDIDDGDVDFTVITDPAVSMDPYYNNYDPPNVAGTNNDDGDTAGFAISPTSGLITTEAGGSDTFTITLTSEPLFDVTIPLDSSDTSEGLIASSPNLIGTFADVTLVFDASNWDTGFTITVTGQDDLIDDGDVAYSVITGSSTSLDDNYDIAGGSIPDVGVTNQNDDIRSVSVVPTSLTLAEDGPADTFDVVLTTMPTATVTVPIGPPDATEATVSTTSLTFTTGDYNVPQTVTVTPIQDFIVDGDQMFTLVNGPASGGDYDGSAVPDVDVTVLNVDDCEPLDVSVGVDEEIIIFNGVPTCVVDVYSTNCSNNPADWMYLGTFEIGPDGTVDTGIDGEPDSCYVVTITGTFVILNSGQARTVPTLGEWGMIAMVGLLLMTALFFMRRRRLAA